MSIRLRLVLLLLALLVFVLAASSWLLLRAYQSEHAAQEQAARISSLAMARLLDKEPRTASTAQALAAIEPLLDTGWPGFLVDSAGRAVPAGPAFTAGQPALPADFGERLAASLAQGAAGSQSPGKDSGQGMAQGWLDLPDAQGGPLRAFFSRSAQGWTWVSWVPCSALDPACSRPVKGMIWVAIVLFAVAGVGLARLALRGSSGLVWPATGGKAEDKAAGDAASTEASPAAGAPRGRADSTDPEEAEADAQIQNERLQVVGRLAGRFSHEFNNQLGVLSNSAYLIERRSEDPRLRLPAQAMLRSVDTASRLTQQLLRFGPRHSTHAQVVDLYRWLPGLQGTLAVVLGKRMALEVAEPAEASQPGQPIPRLGVHVDPDELELALISIFLAVRDALSDGAQVRLAARPLRESAAAAASQTEKVEIRIEAVAHWPGAAEAGAEAGAGEAAEARLAMHGRQDEPLSPAALNDADADTICGLSLARRLCLARGGVVRAEGDSGRCLVVSLILPRVAMAAQDCLAQSLD